MSYFEGDGYDCEEDSHEECDGIAIEGCAKKVPNAFELVTIASQRVFSILDGGRITVPNAKQNNKAIVVALREIAQGNLDADALKLAVACRRAGVNVQKYSNINFYTDNVDEEKLESLKDDMGNVMEDAADAVASIGITHSVRAMSEGASNEVYDNMSLSDDEEKLYLNDLAIDEMVKDVGGDGQKSVEDLLNDDS